MHPTQPNAANSRGSIINHLAQLPGFTLVLHGNEDVGAGFTRLRLVTVQDTTSGSVPTRRAGEGDVVRTGRHLDSSLSGRDLRGFSEARPLGLARRLPLDYDSVR